MNFSKKNNNLPQSFRKQHSILKEVMSKTNIIVVMALFILSSIHINAQKNIPKTKIDKKTKLEKIKYKPIKLITGGNQGFVFVDDGSNNFKKISNVVIVFKSEDGTITKKVTTDSYGYYKIALKPARYVVTINHKGYSPYTTAPGFTVINKEFGTFNIPLKNLFKKPLKLITGGNQGFVFVDDGSNNFKKIPNVEIVFKSEDGSITKKVTTKSSGYYKIKLPSARYTVTIKHKGYSTYTTAPGFTVINKKYRTANFPLKKLFRKKPLRGKTISIMAVFNSETGKLTEVMHHNKKNKKSLAKSKNTIVFYGKSNRKINAKEFAKGTTISVDLGQSFVPGDMFIPGDEFIPGGQFIPGDEFKLNNTKFKVASKTKKELKIIAL